MVDKYPDVASIMDNHEVTRYWVERAFDRDMYYVCVAKYFYKDGIPERSHYLSRDGVWREYQPGEVVPAVINLPGIVLHTLAQGEILEIDRWDISQALTKLANEIIEKVQKTESEANATETTTETT